MAVDKLLPGHWRPEPTAAASPPCPSRTHALLQRVAQQLQDAFDIPPTDCLHVSAKTGLHLHTVLPAVVERIPPPRGDVDGDLRMLLFDAYHDEYRWAPPA